MPKININFLKKLAIAIFFTFSALLVAFKEPNRVRKFNSNSMLRDEYKTTAGVIKQKNGLITPESLQKIADFDFFNHSLAVFERKFSVVNFAEIYSLLIDNGAEVNNKWLVTNLLASSSGLPGDDGSFVHEFLPINIKNKFAIFQLSFSDCDSFALIDANNIDIMPNELVVKNKTNGLGIILVPPTKTPFAQSVISADLMDYHIVQSHSLNNLLVCKINKKHNNLAKKAKSASENNKIYFGSFDSSHNAEEVHVLNINHISSHLIDTSGYSSLDFKTLSPNDKIIVKPKWDFYHVLNNVFQQESNYFFSSYDKDLIRQIGMVKGQGFKPSVAQENIMQDALVSAHNFLSYSAIKVNKKYGFFPNSNWKKLHRKEYSLPASSQFNLINTAKNMAFASYFVFIQDYESEFVNFVDSKGDPLRGDSSYSMVMPDISGDWSISIYRTSDKSLIGSNFVKSNINNKTRILFSANNCEKYDEYDTCLPLENGSNWYVLLNYNFNESTAYENSSLGLDWKPSEIIMKKRK